MQSSSSAACDVGSGKTKDSVTVEEQWNKSDAESEENSDDDEEEVVSDDSDNDEEVDTHGNNPDMVSEALEFRQERKLRRDRRRQAQRRLIDSTSGTPYRLLRF